VLTKPERERVAHHEVGHALVALVLPGTDPVHKISIVPRGISALGYTLQLPTEERFLMTKTELENKIAVLMGGRAAEELVYGEVSTGAHDDLRKATDIAKRMVKEYGMSETIGTITLDPPAPSIFLQQTESRAPGDYSEEIAREVDREVRRVIDSQRRRVTDWLTNLKPVLLEGARLLLEKEVIAGEELQTLISKHRNVPMPVTSAPHLL
jgi:cell division protease FtsH